MGYDILEIYEVLHWTPNEKFHNSTGRGGLFTEYINMFLHIKTQASGYPDSVYSLEQRQEYIEEYASNEGIILIPKFIGCNPGLCSIAKLASNSFYGKFGQHSNMSKMAYITCYEKLYDFLTNQTKVMKDFHFLIWVWLLWIMFKVKSFKNPTANQMSSLHPCVVPMHV